MKRIKAFGLNFFGMLKLVDLPSDTDGFHAAQEPPSESNTPIRAQSINKRYIPLRLLGGGGNGQVHLCRDAQVGTLVAVKTVHHSEPLSPPLEARILRSMGQNANIVRYHIVLNHPSQDFYMQLVFEYCELGDLGDYITGTMNDATPETFIWHAFKHITSGLHFIHSKGVVHGDLKCANVLLMPTTDGTIYPTLKISDFGAAELNPPHHVPLGHFGTLGYQPPESNTRHGPEGDVWALGCIIHELTARCLPELELQEPALDLETWFAMSGRIVPPGTLDPGLYKHLCHYMAYHPITPVRIDHPPRGYSKLLNYFMMRALDTFYRTRITAYELQRSLPVLEKLVRDSLLSGQEWMLDRFDDSSDSRCELASIVTDSGVFEQVYYVLAIRARQKQNAELLVMGTPLLNNMDSAERVAAC